ncbi:dolichol kinase [Haloglomus litoreum]|uniref:dolichol kinase n=1 Tax=Haloglomus litoreum TaxID=3034026 RepID=UPI0023E852F2|nr:dolichol kinase [Haloglomus sp. DT116]
MPDTAGADGGEGGADGGASADTGTDGGGVLSRLRHPEIERRLVHVSGALAPASYLLGVFTWRQLGLVLLGGSMLAAMLEAGRLSGRLDLSIYDRLTREYEQDNVAGYALYVVSVTLVVLLFEPRVAIPAVLALAIADPVSGLLGSGELRDVKQGYVLLATFGVATGLASFFVPPLAAVLGGLATALADGVKPVVSGYVLDDNLTIPPAAAVAMTLGLELAGRLPALG